MHDSTTPEADVAQKAQPPPRPLLLRRGLNASIATINAGFPAVGKIELSDRTYFRFPNGQLRRQIGEGHSVLERNARRARRNAERTIRRIYKRHRIAA